MPEIFWKSQNDTVILEPKPFNSEDEFEDYLVNNTKILGDIFILSKQTRSGTGNERSDIIGIDNDNNIVLIELKNEKVREDIISQVLRYALWAETHPDSLQSLWLQCKDKPDELAINFENLSIKIMVIAPSINPSVARFVDKVTYPIELVEINRYQSKGEEFILVNPLEAEPEAKIKPVKIGQVNYTKKWYEENLGRNKDSIDPFFETVEKIDNLVSKKGWDVKKKLNKWYIGWKYGSLNVFGVTWIGTKSFAIFFKIEEEALKTIDVPTKPLRYENQWSQAIYKVDSDNYDVEALIPLFEASLKNITGQ
jgi:hypothetical protein